MTNTETPLPAARHTVTPDAVAVALLAVAALTIGRYFAQSPPPPIPPAALGTIPAAATGLADHDNDPSRWTPDELQHDHHATDAPPPPAPQYPPGLDVSKYVRAPLAPQHPGRT